jgi:hypothetical protein
MNHKIGIINHCATGEGLTVLIYVNYSREEIESDAGSYLSRGLDVYDSDEVLNANVDRLKDKEPIEMKSALMARLTMESHTPSLLNSIKRKINIKSKYMHHSY